MAEESEASRRYHSLLRFASGVVATFYGRKLAYSILFSHSFSTAGWPVIQPALLGILASFRRARQTIDAELPELRAVHGAAAQALRRLSSVREAYLEAQARNDSESADRLAAQLNELQAEMSTVTRASSSFSAIMRALEPSKLLELARSFYSGASLAMHSLLSRGRSCGAA